MALVGVGASIITSLPSSARQLRPQLEAIKMVDGGRICVGWKVELISDQLVYYYLDIATIVLVKVMIGLNGPRKEPAGHLRCVIQWRVQERRRREGGTLCKTFGS